jgi:hypothetical protein
LFHEQFRKPAEYRSLTRQPIYGSKNSAIHEDIEISTHPTIDKQNNNTLRARQSTVVSEPQEEFESYPKQYFNQICQTDDYT